MLEDVYVHDPGSFICSDHSPVTFSIFENTQMDQKNDSQL